MSDDNLYRTPAADLGGSRAGSGMVDDLIIEPLRRTKFWVQLIGVMLLLFTALIVIGIVMGLVSGAAMMGGNADMMGGAVGVAGLMIVYGIMALVYGYLGLALYRYGKNIGKAAESRDAVDVGNALNNQRGFWKVMGIFTLIGLVVTVLALVLGIGGALIGMSQMG